MVFLSINIYKDLSIGQYDFEGRYALYAQNSKKKKKIRKLHKILRNKFNHV